MKALITNYNKIMVFFSLLFVRTIVWIMQLLLQENAFHKVWKRFLLRNSILLKKFVVLRKIPELLKIKPHHYRKKRKLHDILNVRWEEENEQIKEEIDKCNVNLRIMNIDPKRFNGLSKEIVAWCCAVIQSICTCHL